jgi:hypothetical protein
MRRCMDRLLPPFHISPSEFLTLTELRELPCRKVGTWYSPFPNWGGATMRIQRSRDSPLNSPSSSRYSSRLIPLGSRKYRLSSTPGPTADTRRTLLAVSNCSAQPRWRCAAPRGSSRLTAGAHGPGGRRTRAGCGCRGRRRRGWIPGCRGFRPAPPAGTRGSPGRTRSSPRRPGRSRAT